MGRAGGSGGSRGGGFSGGSRSSGFGGGRSSGFGGNRGSSGRNSSSSNRYSGSSSSGWSSSSSSGWNSRPSNNVFFVPTGGSGLFSRPGNSSNYSNNNGSVSSNKGCGTGCGTAVVVALVVLLALMLIGGLVGGFSNDSDNIPHSTYAREKLPNGAVKLTDYYYDDLNWIGSDRGTLLQGLKYFYQKTGVQPYLLITDDFPGITPGYEDKKKVEEAAKLLYDEMFDDNAHLFVLFFEDEYGYFTYYLAGSQASSVIDSEAGDILLKYLDHYYTDDSMDDAQYFSTAFTKAADRIMTNSYETDKNAKITVTVVVGVLALAGIGLLWWTKAKKRKKEELEQIENILQTPLERLDDNKLDDLEEKYTNGNSIDPTDMYGGN